MWALHINTATNSFQSPFPGHVEFSRRYKLWALTARRKMHHQKQVWWRRCQGPNMPPQVGDYTPLILLWAFEPIGGYTTLQSWANYWLTCNLVTNYSHECNLNYKLLWNFRPNYKLVISNYLNYKLHAIVQCGSCFPIINVKYIHKFSKTTVGIYYHTTKTPAPGNVKIVNHTFQTQLV